MTPEISLVSLQCRTATFWLSVDLVASQHLQWIRMQHARGNTGSRQISAFHMAASCLPFPLTANAHYLTATTSLGWAFAGSAKYHVSDSLSDRDSLVGNYWGFMEGHFCWHIYDKAHLWHLKKILLGWDRDVLKIKLRIWRRLHDGRALSGSKTCRRVLECAVPRMMKQTLGLDIVCVRSERQKLVSTHPCHLKVCFQAGNTLGDHVVCYLLLTFCLC